ncbi:DUF4190 domain-containing protein [Pengzhenrongella sicca]|uniref:DUF4190 domain-containing protein n=1 Tax=Pengzhenrongella sicca TaxID=2819238 RepID=A0A8A4ZEG8_9MICO|nr:DUF4190 domain-containing protein [Pengzhenrongella sicca]QTE29303.1 DUF4190 domain-containing protein [Pengzhenrongella sicca]
MTDPPPAAPPPARTNPLAVISLVAGLCGFSLVPFFGSVAAVVTGHLALRQLRTSGEDGTGFARAGLWLGYLALGLTLVLAVAFLGLVVVRSGTA